MKRIAALFASAVCANVGYLAAQATVAPVAEHSDADLQTAAAVSDDVRLVDEHADDCWAATDAPLADIPGGAIVRLTGKDGAERVVYTEKHRYVDAAFTEVLAALGYADDPGDDGVETVRLCIGPTA